MNQENVSQNKIARPILGGIIAGQAAGLIMAVAMILVFSIFLGKSPLYPVQVIGSALLGESALIGFNFSAIVAGLIIHQAGPALFWGFVFGLLARKYAIHTAKKALMFGLVVGIIAMVVGPDFLVPAFMISTHGVDIRNREVPMGWDWVAHLVFGASFVLYPFLQKKCLGREKSV